MSNEDNHVNYDIPATIANSHHRKDFNRKTFRSLIGIKKIIAVSSGKGGVGKSTTAINLALSLEKLGYNVGILDADIHGPSIPTMLGLSTGIETLDGKIKEPRRVFNIQAMSIGFIAEPGQAMSWRGSMITTALQQLITQTHWDEVDYLVIDMPPGTGDVQQTLINSFDINGAVIVTTPQDIALIDTLRGISMFKDNKVNILGLVENMSIHICKNCGQYESIFGDNGGVNLAADNDIEVLGKLPLDIDIRKNSDKGTPIVISEPESPIAKIFLDIARQVVDKLIDRSL